VDVNKGNGSKKTSLHCVCEEGNERIAKYLIEHGAGMRIVDMNGDSPLFMTCKSGNENLVKYLVELGANIKNKKKMPRGKHFCLWHVKVEMKIS